MIANQDINAPQVNIKEKGAQDSNKKENSAQGCTKAYIQANYAQAAPNNIGTTRPKNEFY